MSSQHTPSPEERAEIEAELRAVGGATLPLETPSPFDSPSPVENVNTDAFAAAPAVASEIEEGDAKIPSPPTRIMPEEEAAQTTNKASSEETTEVSRSVEDQKLQVEFAPPPHQPFATSLSLELKCALEGARIFYSLGSGSVDENGLIFDPKNPILLTQSTLVATRVCFNGEWGPLQSARFEINKPVWQEVEPQDQSDPTPHKISENLDCEDGWALAAASVRGKLHAHRGNWREDSFGLAYVEAEGGSWSVTVVSDGAGSSPLSRVGSTVACAAAIDSLRASLGAIRPLSQEQPMLVAQDLPVLRQALMQAGADALNAIKEQTQTRGKPLTAFAATLLVLVRREWNGAQLCAALQVGDGAIALWDGRDVTLLGEADHGQNSGETRFLTTLGIENELAARVKFSIKSRLEGFVVLSDGVSDDFFPEETRLGEVFTAILPLTQSSHDVGQSLISWLGYEKRGSSDDRTLIVGWPRRGVEEQQDGG